MAYVCTYFSEPDLVTYLYTVRDDNGYHHMVKYYGREFSVPASLQFTP